MMLEPRGAGAEWQRSNLPFGSIAAEQSDAHAGNGLDVSAYPCVGVAARNRLAPSFSVMSGCQTGASCWFNAHAAVCS